MGYFSERESIPFLLASCARERPRHVVIRAGEEVLDYETLNARVNRLAQGFAAAGVAPESRVAVMLSHHLDHALTFYALAKLGVVQVPVNVHLKGAGLQHVLTHSSPAFVVADSEYADTLGLAMQGMVDAPVCIWRGELAAPARDDLRFADVLDGGDQNLGVVTHDSDLRSILYTSGTTGPAKGVLMTDRMYRAAALGSIWIGDIEPGSVLHFWDPIYHVFGSEVLVMALMRPITLAFVPGFSASAFWDQTRAFGATHVHFVGGVLQLLLKQPPSAADRDHRVRIAWGGGAPVDVWRDFQERFGVCVREGYGMTETSSFSVINTDGPIGSIGRPVAYFDVRILEDDGTPVPAGQVGEICVAEKEPGTLTKGYYRNPEKTADLLRGGWLHTGDLGRCDAEGFLYFLGRMKDSLRRRGENISAWEVEQVVNGHPQVEECALVGVVNEFQDEDLKLFVKLKPGIPALDFEEFLAWCRARMAEFQIPRFVSVVESFPKTPTQRIRKELLSRTLDDGWDAQTKLKRTA